MINYKINNIFSIILNKGDINQIIKDLEIYEVSQICDEMAIYLKDKMLSKDTKFDLLLFDRFFRILSEAKYLLALNSDDGFVLILTLLKLIEATNLKSIDEIIEQIESDTNVLLANYKKNQNLIELRNLVITSKIITASAIKRKHSLGTHFIENKG